MTAVTTSITPVLPESKSILPATEDGESPAMECGWRTEESESLTGSHDFLRDSRLPAPSRYLLSGLNSRPHPSPRPQAAHATAAGSSGEASCGRIRRRRVRAASILVL